uniref:Uncharacterized protein n=1 Tax=Anguilla anguilla TaxID=7936 RepID=A0A0E9RYG7_ANGAN
MGQIQSNPCTLFSDYTSSRFFKFSDLKSFTFCLFNTEQFKFG